MKYSNGYNIPAHVVREIAVKAGCDPRSIKTLVEGRMRVGLLSGRIRTAISDLKIDMGLYAPKIPTRPPVLRPGTPVSPTPQAPGPRGPGRPKTPQPPAAVQQAAAADPYAQQAAREFSGGPESFAELSEDQQSACIGKVRAKMIAYAHEHSCEAHGDQSCSECYLGCNE